MMGENYFYITWSPPEAFPYYEARSHKTSTLSDLKKRTAHSSIRSIPKNVNGLDMPNVRLPQGVIQLERQARARGFKLNAIRSLYLQAISREDQNLQEALEKGEGVFVAIGKDKRGKTKYYLIFPKLQLGHGATAEVVDGMSRKGARRAIRQLRSSDKNSKKKTLLSLFKNCINHLQKKVFSLIKKPFSLKNDPYVELKGASYVIQRKGSEGNYSVFERGEKTLQEYMPQSFGTRGDDEELALAYVVESHWLLDLVEGISELTAAGYLQLDLKADNTMLVEGRERRVLKLIDLDACAVLDQKGKWVGDLTEGNVCFFSPERRAFALGKRGYGSVSEKDNIWGAMDLLCRMSECIVEGSSPALKLSEDFYNRFKLYETWSQAAAKAAKKAQMEYIIEKRGKGEMKQEEIVVASDQIYRKAFHEHMLTQMQTHCGSSQEGNLFYGLMPQTEFDHLVMQMAYLHPDQRLSIDEAKQQLHRIINS